jgi:fructose-bisphosphate aldolase, class I
MATTLTRQQSRLSLNDLDHLSTGKKARLHRLMYEHGPGNGMMMFLPIDQGLEHGPINFFQNPPSGDPNFQCQLAMEGRYSAIVFQLGLAEKYVHQYAGRLPLVLKLNGKTSIPNDDNAFSPLIGTVEDAVRLGADAVGYTLYIGSPSQDRDIAQFMEVRREAEKYGMPVIMWAYPRGSAVTAKGGKDTWFAIDYAARVACEVGADVVKVNFPSLEPEGRAKTPAPYSTMDITFDDACRHVVKSAGKTLVIFSGGAKVADDILLSNVKSAVDSGANGLIFGRNMWLRPMDEAVTLSHKITEILKKA